VIGNSSKSKSFILSSSLESSRSGLELIKGFSNMNSFKCLESRELAQSESNVEIPTTRGAGDISVEES
jgi:hypothetical protein